MKMLTQQYYGYKFTSLIGTNLCTQMVIRFFKKLRLEI